MAQHRAARLIAMFAVLLVGACTSTTTVQKAPKSDLRGAAVTRFACPPHPVLPAQQVTPIGSPRAFLLCPLSIPGLPRTAVTITPTQAPFSALIATLSAPDESPTTGACYAYGDVPQVVLASTNHGAYQVSIPVDACHHYQQAALDELRRARTT